MALYAGGAAASGARRLFCILYAAALAWVSLSPSPPGRFLLFGMPHADKAAHFLAYAFLAWLAIWSLKDPRPSLAVGFSFAAAAAAYGAALELAQPAVSAAARECSVFDMAANAAGAAAAVPLWRMLSKARTGTNGRKEPAS